MKYIDNPLRDGEDWLMIQPWMTRLGLSAAELNIFARIFVVTQKTDGVGDCEPARQLGYWAGLKVRQTMYILRKLEDEGYIKRIPQGTGRPNIYKSMEWDDYKKYIKGYKKYVKEAK